jgi:hypothetical protein
METQTVHFRVGADMGIILMQIAHEHLVYENDFDKAVRTYTESFGGECPEDLVMQLLTGDMIILVDEEDQMFQVVPRGEHPHLDHLYPKLNVIEYSEKIQNEINDRCADLKDGLNQLVRKFDGKHYQTFNFTSDAVMRYIYGNDEDMIAEIHDNYELNQWQMLIKLSYEFIETSLKKAEVVRRLSKGTDVDAELDTYRLNEIATALQKIAELDFEPLDATVQSYIEATREISETIEKGIEPVDIMDNWSAGWLSPEGDYYALNGEIANMLHIEISKALQDKGIIPEKDKYGSEQNPDSWLEQQGWVKIHGNNVQFAGCLNSKMGLPNIHMTKTQKDIIHKYISVCHGGVVRAGWRLEKVSIARFSMTDDLMLAKHYFSY